EAAPRRRAPAHRAGKPPARSRESAGSCGAPARRRPRPPQPRRGATARAARSRRRRRGARSRRRLPHERLELVEQAQRGGRGDGAPPEADAVERGKDGDEARARRRAERPRERFIPDQLLAGPARRARLEALLDVVAQQRGGFVVEGGDVERLCAQPLQPGERARSGGRAFGGRGRLVVATLATLATLATAHPERERRRAERRAERDERRDPRRATGTRHREQLLGELGPAVVV